MATTIEFLTEQVELSEQLMAERDDMLEPQDLPGRYGRVVQSIDRILTSTGIEAVLGGGWAVWRHGFAARVTVDVDVALPADRIDEFMRVAAISGFQILAHKPGRWPKMMHKDTGVQVDILPEGARPGRADNLAPTTIPHPNTMGATAKRLRYMTLPALMVLKLAAGREKDQFDVVELLRTNEKHVDSLRTHVALVHERYGDDFDRLARSAAATNAEESE